MIKFITGIMQYIIIDFLVNVNCFHQVMDLFFEWLSIHVKGVYKYVNTAIQINLTCYKDCGRLKILYIPIGTDE